MDFRPGELTNNQASELNWMRREVLRLSTLRVAGPTMRLYRGPANIVIESIAAVPPTVNLSGSYGTPQTTSSVTFFVDLNPRCEGGNIVYDRTWITHTLVNGQLVQVISGTDPNAAAPERHWWCTPFGCVQSTGMEGNRYTDGSGNFYDDGSGSTYVSAIGDPPDNYTDGPFATEADCIAGCP